MMIQSVLIAMMLAGAPAAVEPRTAPAPEPTAVSGKRYCVVYTDTDSRIPKRECHSRAEWLKQGVDPIAK